MTAVAGNELLRLLVEERFPAWRLVLNEQAAAVLAERERQAAPDAQGGVLPTWSYDTPFLQRRRAALLDEALTPGCPDDRVSGG